MPENTGRKYGIIEWESSNEPSLIVGETAAEVRRYAAFTLQAAVKPDDWEESSEIGDLTRDASDDEIVAWLDEFRACNSVPWFGMYPATVVDAALIDMVAPR